MSLVSLPGSFFHRGVAREGGSGSTWIWSLVSGEGGIGVDRAIGKNQRAPTTPIARANFSA